MVRAFRRLMLVAGSLTPLTQSFRRDCPRAGRNSACFPRFAVRLACQARDKFARLLEKIVRDLLHTSLAFLCGLASANTELPFLCYLSFFSFSLHFFAFPPPPFVFSFEAIALSRHGNES